MQQINKCKIVFVILQYGAYCATKKCIESIYNNVDEFYIIVVDNCSPDESLTLLKQEYGNSNEVIIIESKSNLGFSRGNNLGFQYAKKNLNPKFIVLMNNDTELLNDSFEVEVQKEYSLSKFAVMGPMILTGDGKYISNPSRVNEWNKEEIRKCIQVESLFLKLERINLGFIYDWYMCYKKSKKNKSVTQITCSLHRQENVELHGSFMIFSEEYIKVFDGLDARTFMYSEEPILYLRLKAHKLKSVYNPKIVIFHAEDVSTNGAHKKGKQKKIFYFETHIQSCKALLDVIKEGEI